MKLLSVNVGQPREINDNGRTFTTSIFKTPVEGRVMMRQLNLDGDRQSDLQNHGGIYKAVYLYPYEHYAAWAQELERDDFIYGQFGENLTVEGLLEDTVCIGDEFRIGKARVQVTQPRSPCYKLVYRMGLPDFVKQFLASGRSGIYLRVLEEGDVGAGDLIEQVKAAKNSLTVSQINNLKFYDKDNIPAIRQAMNLPELTPSWRDSFRKMVEKAEA